MSTPPRRNLRAALDQIARTDRGSRERPFTPAQRQSQILMDRLLDHLEIIAPGEWRVHGSVGILARGVPGARAPKDLDLESMSSSNATEAMELLTAHLGMEGHLPIEFEIRQQRPTRSSVKTLVDVMVEGRFWLILGLDNRARGPGNNQLEQIEPMVDVSSLGLLKVVHHALPAAAQMAEKANGIMVPDIRVRRHGLSTRYKDVGDLILMSRFLSVDVDEVREGLRFAAESVEAEVPRTFTPPSEDPSRSPEVRAQWIEGVTGALRFNGMSGMTCSSAEAELQRFLGPVLDGSATRAWSPDRASWGHELVGSVAQSSSTTEVEVRSTGSKASNEVGL